MRKVFTEDLPRRFQSFDWIKSIGYIIKFIYDDIEGEIKIVGYNAKSSKLSTIYNGNKIIEISTMDFIKGKLRTVLGLRSYEFKIEINTNFKDDKRNITIINREYRDDINNIGKKKKWYQYKCNNCGWEGDDRSWIEESNLKKGRGCPCCNGRTLVEGINDIPTTTPWLIPYFQGGIEQARQYTKGSGKYIYPICPDCGRVKEKKMMVSTIYIGHSIGCSCGDSTSYPEKLMFNILEQLKINFKIQYCPHWAESCKYDFYFEKDNIKYIIEMDGEFHRKDNTMSGQTKEESRIIDDYKDDMADRHGIEMIRIDCYKSELGYITDKIKDSIITQLFDLDIIDWNKAEEFALSNLVKVACNYKKDNPNLTTTQIGEMMKIHQQKITKYLKKGALLGWCDYNPKEERRKACSISGKLHGKIVEIFKDYISLGVFESGSELERQSKKLFGVKLGRNTISETCRGLRETYKGFTFKYI